MITTNTIHLHGSFHTGTSGITGKKTILINVTIFVGEYSALHTDTGARIGYPLLIGTILEVVYLLGCERNSNTVKLVSYAPSMANFGHVDWTPNLLTFSALPF